MDRVLNKNRINTMLDTVTRVARADYSTQIELSSKNDEIDSLAIAINMMNDDLKANTVTLRNINNRIEEILNITQRVARGDYTATCELGEETDIFDALGMGINMMVEDIKTNYENLNRQRKKLSALNKHLQESLAQIETLSGLLPICAWCKQIRNDQGYWQSVEQYIQAHSQAEFTHGI